MKIPSIFISALHVIIFIVMKKMKKKLVLYTSPFILSPKSKAWVSVFDEDLYICPDLFHFSQFSEIIPLSKRGKGHLE